MTNEARRGRPRQFDPARAIAGAAAVFRAKGFAGATTDELLQAMGVGRQSSYAAFGSKWDLYLVALEWHCTRQADVHVVRLNSPGEPLEVIEKMLAELINDQQEAGGQVTFEIGAIVEFGPSEPRINRCRAQAQERLHAALVIRLNDAKSKGQLPISFVAREGAQFLETVTHGIHVSARAGTNAEALRHMVRLAIHALKSPVHR